MGVREEGENVGVRKEVEEGLLEMEDLGGLHISIEEEDGSSDDEEVRKQYGGKEDFKRFFHFDLYYRFSRSV